MERVSKTVVEHNGKKMRFNKEEQIIFIEEMIADLEIKVTSNVQREVRDHMRQKVCNALQAFERVVKSI